MATFNYSGTYMSSWLQPDGTTYLPGPVVVDASTESVSLNGVTIIQPQFNSTANTLSWSSSSGNYSSAQLTFYQNNSQHCTTVPIYLEWDLSRLPQSRYAIYWHYGGQRKQRDLS
jgi:hypothetical protein